MIQVGIVDDHAIVRSGLRQYLSEHVDVRVVGEAANGREAIDLVRNTAVDVLIMDLSMPGQSGLDALAMLRAKSPDTGILILSGSPPDGLALKSLLLCFWLLFLIVLIVADELPSCRAVSLFLEHK